MALFDRIVAVNLKGQLMGCKHAIPHMLAGGGGSIMSTADPSEIGAPGSCGSMISVSA